MAIEIVDFPINSIVIFHSYVNVYQRVTDILLRGFLLLCLMTPGQPEGLRLQGKMSSALPFAHELPLVLKEWSLVGAGAYG